MPITETPAQPSLALPADLCHLHARATPFHIINFLTVGVPSFHVPEEAVETGFVELPPDELTELTVRIPSFMDLYVDRVQIDMWKINGAAPNRELEWLAPVGPNLFGTLEACDVRLRFHDSGFQVDLQRQELPWQQFASDAATPHRLQCPFTWQGDRTYQISVRNFDAVPRAMSIVLIGRRRRVQQSMQGWNSDERRLFDYLVQRETELGNITRGYLTGDHSQNIRGVGQLKMTALPLQPIAITAGPIDTIQERTPEQAIVGMNHRYYYNVRQMMGSQEQGASGKVAGSIAAIFTRVFDDEAQYWISNGWIPFRAIYGSGEQPGRLPVDWAWGRNGNIRYEFRAGTLTATSVMVDIEGSYRALDANTGKGQGW